MRRSGLSQGRLSPGTAHVCVDMQRLFGPGAPWSTPWLPRVLPCVERLVASAPGRTIFTRFMPPERAGQRPGQWQTYFARWKEVTREQVDPQLLRLFASLEAFVPPAQVLDKPAYSPFFGSGLDAVLVARKVDTLIFSGTETDVCLLSGVLDAVDRGYRAIVASDAVCSSSDAAHDAMLDLFEKRFSCQIEVATTAELDAQLRACAAADPLPGTTAADTT